MQRLGNGSDRSSWLIEDGASWGTGSLVGGNCDRLGWCLGNSLIFGGVTGSIVSLLNLLLPLLLGSQDLLVGLTQRHVIDLLLAVNFDFHSSGLCLLGGLGRMLFLFVDVLFLFFNDFVDLSVGQESSLSLPDDLLRLFGFLPVLLLLFLLPFEVLLFGQRFLFLVLNSLLFGGFSGFILSLFPGILRCFFAVLLSHVLSRLLDGHASNLICLGLLSSLRLESSLFFKFSSPLGLLELFLRDLGQPLLLGRKLRGDLRSSSLGFSRCFLRTDLFLCFEVLFASLLLFGFSDHFFLGFPLSLEFLLHLFLGLLSGILSDFLLALGEHLGFLLGSLCCGNFLMLNLFGLLLSLKSLLLQESFLLFDADLKFSLDLLLLEELLAFSLMVLGDNFLLGEGRVGDEGLVLNLLLLDLLLLELDRVVCLSLCLDLGLSFDDNLLLLKFKFSFTFFLFFFIFVLHLELILDSRFGLRFNSDLLKFKLPLLFLLFLLLDLLLFLLLGESFHLFLVFNLLGSLNEGHVFGLLQLLFFKLLFLLEKFVVLVLHSFEGLLLLVSFSLDVVRLINEFLNIQVDFLLKFSHSILDHSLILFFLLFLLLDFFLLGLVLLRMRLLEDLAIHLFGVMDFLVDL